MSDDVYTFDDDLDRGNTDLPADQRAGLTLAYDGEHVVFGLKEHGDNREIYLTPERAGVAARLILQLTDQDDDQADAEKQEMSLARELLTVALFFVAVAWGVDTICAGVSGLIRLVW